MKSLQHFRRNALKPNEAQSIKGGNTFTVTHEHPNGTTVIYTYSFVDANNNGMYDSGESLTLISITTIKILNHLPN
jgi:hypothetical protein